MQFYGITPRAASETIEEVLGGLHGKGRCLLFVQRTETDLPVSPAFEPSVFFGHPNDIHGIANRLDELWGDMDVTE
jgi:hypothetical protein